MIYILIALKHDVEFHNKKILAKVAPKYKIGTLAVVAKL